MTRNKFWLVWSDTKGHPLNPTHDTFAKAKEQARRLTEEHREYHKFYVFEPKCVFSINELIVETDLFAPENDFVELAEPITPETPMREQGDYEDCFVGCQHTYDRCWCKI